MARARAQKTMCSSCGGRIEAGESFCDHCGRPTAWASYEERIDWEVRQWRDARSRTGRAERIEPRYAPSGRSNLAVAEIDEPPAQSVVAAAWEPAATVEPREPLLARLRRLLSRLRALFDVRIDTSSGRSAHADRADETDSEPVAPPTLVVVSEPDEEVTDPVEHIADESVPLPVALEPVAAASEIPAPPDPPVTVEPEPHAPAPVAPAPDATDVATVPVPPAAAAPVAPAASETVAPSAPAASASPKRPTSPRKRPNRPTNKELLQRALTTLERVEQRIHHLEEEIEEIDQAVRKSPAAPSAEDDDLEPPAAAGPFGYI